MEPDLWRISAVVSIPTLRLADPLGGQGPKFIEEELERDEGLRARFAREATLSAQIRSPHVVQIIDHGEDSGGDLFLVMELLQGESLGALLEREGTLSLQTVAQILHQVGKGLSRAHEAGIVHRDIKPDNIFLCPDEDGFLAKVLDFGIARSEQMWKKPMPMTSSGVLLGTPLYMSPEQARARSKVDTRSDLYSLAVVAYHAITGVRLLGISASVLSSRH